MSVILSNKIKVSQICLDHKKGTWWAIGTQKEYLEIRITNYGKIIPFKVVKKKHPYFTFKES